MRALAISLIAMTIAGCQSTSPADPNDPSRQGPDQAQVLRNNLRWASDAANQREARGEITQNEGDQLVRDEAQRLAKKITSSDLQGVDAWKFGEVLLAAHDWPRAEKALSYAVAHPTTVDRSVNDTLRLAQVEAQLGNVLKAIALAKSTFNVDANDKAPILPAVLLAIVPAAVGKGYDAQLADLLVQSAAQHEQVIIDPNTMAGKMFLLAKPRHIRHALDLAAGLYDKTGHSAQAAAVRKKEQPISV